MMVRRPVDPAQARRRGRVAFLEHPVVVRFRDPPAALDELREARLHSAEQVVGNQAFDAQITVLEEGLALRPRKDARRMG